MVALHILRRDLTRYWRNPLRTILLFAIPLVMAGVFDLAFGGGGSENITITILLFDEDQSLLSKLLDGAAGSSETDQHIDIVSVGAEGYAMMERGEASALVHIPPGFTDDFLAGRPTTMTVVKNPSERFLPKIVDEGVRIGAVALSEVSRVFRAELGQISVLTHRSRFPEDLAIGSLSASINNKLSGFERFLFPPVIDVERTTTTSEGAVDTRRDLSILAYVLPGFAVMGILFLAQSATRDLLVDRESGLLRHLLTAPVSPTEYLLGKCLSVFVVTALGFLLLVALGLAAGVPWGPPLPVAALVLSSALAAGGLMLLIMSIVGSERQGDTLTTIVIFVSSMLGGAFMPVSQMPEFIRPISAATLVYWSSEGFAKLIVHGQGIRAIVPNLAVLTTAGLLCMLAGAAMLRRKIERGVV